MLRATGLTDTDIAKPLVAVVHTWSDISPCNLTLRELAGHVREGVRAAGGTPVEFNTIAVTDGIAMGSEGMRASLPSREVIADSIELAVSGHCLDAVAAIVGCDKTIPAAAMALARLDLPIHLGEDAGVVLDAVVSERDEKWHLARATFTDNPDAGVWVRDSVNPGGHAIGHPVRVRILARDVSLAITRHSGTSIQNILPGVVEALADDSHPALALVRVNVGGARVVARLTRRSAHDLGLAPGKIVHAQIKAVALIG